MEELTLTCKKRDVLGKKVAQLRQEKLIPAVIYGRGIENINISIPEVAFEKTYAKTGESTLINLEIEGGTSQKVLVTDTQANPIQDKFDHVDFYQVDMKKHLTAKINLEFTGEPNAVKDLGGTLLTNVHEIEVKCLPGDLVSEITVNLSSLETFDDAIKMENLTLPQGLELQEPPQRVIATVMPPLTEEELAKLDEVPEADVSQVEVEGEKKEDQEGKEEDKKEGKEPKKEEPKKE